MVLVVSHIEAWTLQILPLVGGGGRRLMVLENMNAHIGQFYQYERKSELTPFLIEL